MSYLLSDHLGSTSVTADADGTLLSRTLYSAWGEIRHQAGALPTDYTYTGQYSNTADFGLMYYRARWYDPSLGRFSQADTVVPGAMAIDFDRYAYVRNSPTGAVDPSGHVCATSKNGGKICSADDDSEGWGALSSQFNPATIVVDDLLKDGLRALDGMKFLTSQIGSWWGNTWSSYEMLAILIFQEFGTYIENESYLEMVTRRYHAYCGEGAWSEGCVQGFWGYYEAIRNASSWISKYSKMTPDDIAYYTKYAKLVLNPKNRAWITGKNMDRPFHTVSLSSKSNGEFFTTALSPKTQAWAKDSYTYNGVHYLSLVLTPNQLIAICGNGTECSLFNRTNK